MEMKTWLSEVPRSVGRCRYCATPYANVPDEDGVLPDDLLEEREIRWGFTPLLLTLERSHLPSSAGEWCSWACFEADLSMYFEMREIDRLLDHARLSALRLPDPKNSFPLAGGVAS